METSKKSNISNMLPYMVDKDELMKTLTEYTIETYPENNIIAFYDTDNKIGLFGKSDVIIYYNDDNKPISVTERLHRSDCGFFQWFRVGQMLRNKVARVRQEFGFTICVAFSHDYIDYTHYKMEWLECMKHTMEG